MIFLQYLCICYTSLIIFFINNVRYFYIIFHFSFSPWIKWQQLTKYSSNSLYVLNCLLYNNSYIFLLLHISGLWSYIVQSLLFRYLQMPFPLSRYLYCSGKSIQFNFSQHNPQHEQYIIPLPNYSKDSLKTLPPHFRFSSNSLSC